MYNDNNPYDPSSLTFSETGYFKNFKNQIQLGFNSGSGFDPNADPEIVEIGSGESIDECLPTCTRYKYGLSEQIYTKEEIGKSGIITSIAFLNGVGMMETRSLDIYMVQTDKKGFASSTDVISVSESDKVFSGDVTFAMYDWETIKLNTPFNYDGTSNLAIIVDDNTKRSEQYELKFTVFNSSPNCTAYVYSNNTNYDPANTSNYSYALEGYKNCIQLGIIAGPDPGQVTKTVQIGNAQTSDYNLPVNTYYNYSLTQQIYTAAEIGTEGTITAIAFDYAHSEELSMSGVQMYMKNVSKSKFDSKSDMVSVGASDLVWEGTLSASEAGWMTITLDKPFKYDGKSNLLLCLYDPTNGYPGSTYTFRNTETEETRTLAYWSDSNAPDLGSLTSFSGGAGMKTYRSNIKLYIQTTGSGPGLDFIDFETGDFSQFKFQNDSDYPWIVTNATAADGTYCMRSGNAGVASSSSFITATRTYEEDGYVCFDAKCMGEGTSWDVCNFYIDGEVQFSYGALGNYWAFYYYPVTAGTHTFKWEYKKDGSTDPVGDAFFVDNIRFLEEGRDDDVIVGVSPIGETEEGAAIYNLAGQRLSKMQKGINITGGRKILVK